MQRKGLRGAANKPDIHLLHSVDVFIGGVGYAAGKWVSGIPFDLVHCVGNFFMALLLFVPLRKLITRLYDHKEGKT